mgnify:CR=1 FL=1
MKVSVEEVEKIDEAVKAANAVEKSKDVIETASKIHVEYSTKIDSRVTVIDRKKLPEFLEVTFKNGQYWTVKTDEDIVVYRLFGNNAEAGGAFATTSPAINRIQSKIDSAILPEWKNTLKYEAEIVIPKCTVLSIGKDEEQITVSGTKLAGGADQVLLPEGWDLNWIQNIRTVNP